MLTDIIKETETIYTRTNASLVSYYNKPYNYHKLVSLMNSTFSKLLDVSFISKIFEAKKALHKLEKQFTLDNINITQSKSKIAIEEYRQSKKYRMEAIKNGMTTESAIQAHVDFRMTEFYIAFEEFNAYMQGFFQVREFFDKETRNIEGILSQGKSLSYSGHKFTDDQELFGYETDNQE